MVLLLGHWLYLFSLIFAYTSFYGHLFSFRGTNCLVRDSFDPLIIIYEIEEVVRGGERCVCLCGRLEKYNICRGIKKKKKNLCSQ